MVYDNNNYCRFVLKEENDEMNAIGVCHFDGLDPQLETVRSLAFTTYCVQNANVFSNGNLTMLMALFVNEYFNQSEADLVELGTELKQTILDAMADGIIDEQEMRTIQNLQAEVNQIMAAVADAEYRAQLNNAVFDLDGDLSYDSVKAISDELQTIAQQQLDTLEESHLTALTLIELKYKTDGNYEEYLLQYQSSLKNRP